MVVGFGDERMVAGGPERRGQALEDPAAVVLDHAALAVHDLAGPPTTAPNAWAIA